MPIDPLLARQGLAPALRLMVLAGVAVWRGHWDRLADVARCAAATGRPRADLEEVLLQSVLFCGFPRVVTAFGVLAEAWPTATAPHGGGLPEGERRAAGEALFAAVYGSNEASVRELLQSHHQELHDFVLEAAYGRILARPHLDGRVRELIAVAVLAAQEQLRQFAGHARGALHLGASREEVREAVLTAFDGDDGRAERWLDRLR